jgi:hypothetical protein
MSKAFVALVSVVLGLLAWLALDDITTGSEPNHLLEWAMVGVTTLWFGGLAWRRLSGSAHPARGPH